MKKTGNRIISGLFTIIVIFLSVFNSYDMPVYGQALPDPSPSDLARNSFTLINGNNETYIGDFISQWALQMLFAGPQSGEIIDSNGNVINPEPRLSPVEVADLALADFINEYGDDIYNVAVVQPSDAAYQLFINYPSQAIDYILQESAAGFVVVEGRLEDGSDTFIAYSGDLINNAKKFLHDHIKNNKYYSVMPANEEDIDPWDGKPKLNEKVKFSITCLTYSGKFYQQNIADNNNTYNNIVGTYENNQVKVYNFINNNASLITGTFKQYDSYDKKWRTYNNQYNFQNVSTYNVNFPIFANTNALLNACRTGNYEDALNYPELEPDKITVPLTMPLPLEEKILYSLQQMTDYLQNLTDLANGIKSDLELNPGNYPLPDYFPVPIQVPDNIIIPPPAPIDDIQPVITPDPVDPDPDPVNPDPDPIDPDPDPVNPDPDPDIPDPDDEDDEGNPIIDLSQYFPFCLPMDLYLTMMMLQADSMEEYYNVVSVNEIEDPAGSGGGHIPKKENPVTFQFPITFELFNGDTYTHEFTLDIIQPAGEGTASAEPFVKYFRWFLTFLYIIFLIFATIKIIPR